MKSASSWREQRDNTKVPEELIFDPAIAREQLKLLWLSCGNKDGLIRISQRTHRYLKEKNVPHIWNVDSYGHDPTHWRNNLHHFVQLVFNEKASKAALSRATVSRDEKPAPKNMDYGVLPEGQAGTRAI